MCGPLCGDSALISNLPQTYAKVVFSLQTIIFPPPLPLLCHHNLSSPYTSLSGRWCIFSQSTKPKLKPDPYPKNCKDLAGNWQGMEIPGAASFTAFAAVCCMLPTLEPQAGVWSGLFKAGPRSEVSARSWLPHHPIPLCLFLRFL